MCQKLKKLPFLGNSMNPLLKNGDEILFEDHINEIVRGDILLFKDPSTSEFIVHRVLQVQPFLTKGDWSCHTEEVPESHIFGKVVGYKRNNNGFLFDKTKMLLSIWVFLSKQLLSTNRILRIFSRAALLLLNPMLSKKKSGL